MKKSTRVCLSLIAISLVLIGLGCGIAVFEFSNYKIADYRTEQLDSLPPLEWTQQDFIIPLQKDAPVVLELYAAENICYDYDETIKDQLTVHIENVTGVPDCSLNSITDANGHYSLNCSWKDFSELKQFLRLAKEGYVLQSLPPVSVIIRMNPADADRIQVNPPFDTAVSGDNTEEDLQIFYEEQLQAQQEQHMAELEERDVQLGEMQQLYEEQLAQKEEAIQELTLELENLQAQLDRIRASVNE